MKKASIIVLTFLILAAQTASVVRAQGQSPADQVIQNVKDSVGALIQAKDQNAPNESDVRLETYKTALDLALNDARELRLDLIAYDDGTSSSTTSTVTLWKNDTVDQLSDAVKHYQNEKDAVNALDNPSTGDVKARAEALKAWREKVYLPLSDEVQGFLLISGQKKSLDITDKRMQKVSNDVEKLRKAHFRQIKTLDADIKKANDLIGQAKDELNAADKQFTEQYLLSFMSNNDPAKVVILKEMKDEASATSTASSTASGSPSPSPSSIKDTVGDSFAKVKSAYAIFIEMSDLVRKSS